LHVKLGLGEVFGVISSNKKGRKVSRSEEKKEGMKESHPLFSQ
jgi:hypothetical protein